MTLTIGQPALVKLVSGEELIGKITALNADIVTLDKPLGVGYEMKQPGKIGFGFLPYLPMAKGDARSFDRSHVINIVEPNDQLAQAYEQATSMIAVPNRSLLLEDAAKQP